jgi:hypothetical protein
MHYWGKLNLYGRVSAESPGDPIYESKGERVRFVFPDDLDCEYDNSILRESPSVAPFETIDRPTPVSRGVQDNR